MKTKVQPLPVKIYEFKCNNTNCQAVMEASKEEGRILIDRNESLIGFNCPHCGQETFIKL